MQRRRKPDTKLQTRTVPHVTADEIFSRIEEGMDRYAERRELTALILQGGSELLASR